MVGHDDFVLAALVEEGLVTREAVEQARKHAAESDRSPSEALSTLKIIDARTIALVRAQVAEYPFVDPAHGITELDAYPLSVALRAAIDRENALALLPRLKGV